MISLKGITPLGRWALGLGLALVLALIIGGVLLFNAWQSAATAKTEARLSTNQTGAAIASGVDAVETVGKVGAAEVQIDIITRENERAIRQAPGATAPVDPDLHAAGLRALCARASYRGEPECVQRTGPE